MSKELKKSLIADVAFSCFLSSGYGGTSVDDIVRAAGISKGGLYWHFKSKEDIFLYLIGKWIKEYDQELLLRLAEEYPVREKLKKFVDYYLENVNVPIIALIKEFLMQAKDVNILNELKSLIADSEKNNIIKNVIMEAVRKGECKTVDVEAAAYAFMGMFEGIGMIWSVSHKDKQLLERTARIALNIYLEGILNK
ncbi:MAG: TetR/AcrR family transcriptional regulator [Desulfotomaculaceae bacterium]|nr:TetR/AcrR family transcriptional regulator [Desulfotomaculaceae bacterium]